MAERIINYGLVGLGTIARVRLTGLASIPIIYESPPVAVNLRSLYTTHLKENGNRARKIGFDIVTSDWEEFFTGVDVVDICTPNSMHREVVERAVNYDVAVYCEKPLSNNLEDARKMYSMVKDNGIPNAVAFMYRSLPAVAEAKAFVEDGRLGEITSFRAHVYHGSYNTPKRPTAWRLQHKMSGGGALADLGIHLIDIIRYILGDFQSVHAKTKTVYKERPAGEGSRRMVPVDVDDWALVNVELANGGMGSIEVSRLASGAKRPDIIEIFGTRGSITISPDNPYRASLYDANSGRSYIGGKVPGSCTAERISKLFPSRKMSMGWMVDSHLTGLLRFLTNTMFQTKDFGIPDFAEALEAQKILTAAYTSAERNGATIEIV